jgi:hypothetical protein
VLSFMSESKGETRTGASGFDQGAVT